MNRPFLFVVLIIYLIFDVLMSVLPTAANIIPNEADWIIHLISFLLLTMILLKIFENVNYHVFLVLGIMVFLSIVSEVIQIPIPGRTFSYYDMLSDIVGTVIGIIIDFCMRHKWF